MIRITDNGEGINGGLDEQIIQQMSKPWMNIQGSGFGLYMARETTAKMGGKLIMQSNPGQGSEFSIILPR